MQKATHKDAWMRKQIIQGVFTAQFCIMHVHVYMYILLHCKCPYLKVTSRVFHQKLHSMYRSAMFSSGSTC